MERGINSLWSYHGGRIDVNQREDDHLKELKEVRDMIKSRIERAYIQEKALNKLRDNLLLENGKIPPSTLHYAKKGIEGDILELNKVLHKNEYELKSVESEIEEIEAFISELRDKLLEVFLDSEAD